MAGMETFSDGSTGKFSHPQKKPEEGWGWLRYASCRLNFFSSFSPFLSSAVLYTPLSPFSNHNLSVLCHFKKAKDRSHIQEESDFPHGSVLRKGSAERGREISVLMILCGAGLFLFYWLERNEFTGATLVFWLSHSLSLHSTVLPCSFAPWTNSVVSSCLLCMLHYRGNVWFGICSVLCI